MEITQGPKQTRPLANFFDDEMTTTTREILYDGKPWAELKPEEQAPAMQAWERHHQKHMGGWAFLVGLGGFYVLTTAPLTLAGVIAVIGVTALICWAMITKL